MRRFVKITSRLLATGFTVAAIGWGFVTLNAPDPSGNVELGVQESRADIFGMSFAERTSTQKFQAALERLGHEKPRVYDHNGNTVMFSTTQYRGDIDAVVRRYMQAFAEEGLNPHSYNGGAVEQDSEYRSEMSENALKGGVVPWVIREDYLAMGGAVLDIDVEDQEEFDRRLDQNLAEIEELLDRFDDAYRRCGGDPDAFQDALRSAGPIAKKRARQSLPPDACSGGLCDERSNRLRRSQRRQGAIRDVITADPELAECGPVRDVLTAFTGIQYDDFTNKLKAFRSIEAWYNPVTGVSKITASWSDETFDAKKAHPSRYGGRIDSEAARKIPLCPDCRRIYALQGTGSEHQYSSNVLVSPSDPARTAHFYRNELQKQGWEIPESEVVVQELQRLGAAALQDAQWLRMRRGEEFLYLNFSRDAQGRTIVRSSTAP